jgi:Voltage gated chloride channel
MYQVTRISHDSTQNYHNLTRIDIPEDVSDGSGWDDVQRDSGPEPFNPMSQIGRLVASVFTLASGCSLGPEGPSVEIGARWVHKGSL